MKIKILKQIFHKVTIHLFTCSMVNLKQGNKKHLKTQNSNLILLEKGNFLKVKAIKNSEFLFIAGKPIGEKIARGGPFVMNTKEEIIQAIEDYKNGTFVKQA